MLGNDGVANDPDSQILTKQRYIARISDPSKLKYDQNDDGLFQINDDNEDDD